MGVSLRYFSEPHLMQEDARKTPADGIAGASPELLVQKFSPLPTNSRLGDLTVQSVLGAGENAITTRTGRVG